MGYSTTLEEVARAIHELFETSKIESKMEGEITFGRKEKDLSRRKFGGFKSSSCCLPLLEGSYNDLLEL